MSIEDVPADSVEAVIRADDDAATAEARQDGLATVRYWSELNTAGVPEELTADLCRIWLESYLDGAPCDE